MKIKRTIYLLTALLALATISCKEKEEKKDIIVPAPVEKVKKGTQQMSETKYESEEQWLGKTYKIIIIRTPDKSLPQVNDENGNAYYDNTITLRIVREDGTDFVNKTYRKSDFAQHVESSDYIKNGALLGIVFDEIKDNKLTFAASIGSPDVTSDEFVPLILTINNMGETSIKADTQMDRDSGTEADSNGITGDEEA